MDFSIKGPDPASQHLNEKKRSKNAFNLYETHITPLGIPIPTVPRLSDGVGYGGLSSSWFIFVHILVQLI